MLKNLRFYLRRPRIIPYSSWMNKVRPYTFCNNPLFLQTVDLVKELPEGPVVEIGCWKGGWGAFIASLGREVWQFDSFEGLPKPREDDYQYIEDPDIQYQEGHLKTRKEVVYEACDTLNVKTHIVEGWIEDTYEEVPDKIAMLIIDVDYYSPTKFAFEKLYDKVVPGGVTILNDYMAWQGCRKAVYEVLSKQTPAPILYRKSYGGNYYIKHG